MKLSLLLIYSMLTQLQKKKIKNRLRTLAISKENQDYPINPGPPLAFFQFRNYLHRLLAGT